MLPLLHTLSGSGSHDREIGQPRQENGSNGRQNGPPVIDIQDAGDAGRASRPKRGVGARVGKRENDGDGGLHGEVDGEDLGHESGELRTREDLKGDDPADEGLCWGWRLVIGGG